MYNLLAKTMLAPNIWQFTLSAPKIAIRRQPGNFIILRPTRNSERIPLTIVDSNPEQGSLEIIFQVVGATTAELAQMEVGAEIADVAGPLGQPTHVEKYGTVIMIGGGVGIAPLFPIARAFRDAGNKVISILGARSQNLLILEKEIASISDHFVVATDDGSRGRKGLVTDVLQELIAEEPKIDFVMAIGPIVMMQAASEVTRKYGIKTMVSLNPLMIDGTGMCGGCRCKIEGKTKFACVDGPEFDGHQVDFNNLRRRLGMFKNEEQEKFCEVKL